MVSSRIGPALWSCSLLLQLAFYATAQPHIAVILDGSPTVGELSFGAWAFALEDLMVSSFPGNTGVALFGGTKVSSTWKPLEKVVEDQDFRNLHHSQQRFDPNNALITALGLTQNQTQAIVLIATDGNMLCSEVPYCRSVESLKGRGVIVITVAFTFYDTGPLPIIDLATEGFALTSTEKLYSDFRASIEKAQRIWSSNRTLWRPMGHKAPEKKTVAKQSELSIVRGNDSLCSMDRAAMAIDIFVLLDSSATVGATSFTTIKSAASGLLDQLNFGQSSHQSRLGIMVLGEKPLMVHTLEETKSTAQVMRALENAPFTAAPFADIHRAFAKMNDLLKHKNSDRPALVLLLSNQHVADCVGPHLPDLCRSAAALQALATVSTVAFNFYDTTSSKLSPLASPCSSMRNDEQMLKSFHLVLSRSTCGCALPWSQFHYDQCTPTTSCLRLMETYVPFRTAKSYCERVGASVVTIHGPTKDDFVRNLGTERIFIGLQIDDYQGPVFNATGHWTNGDSWSIVRSFKNYGGFGVPVPGQCTAMHNGEWSSVDCDNEENVAQYVCEKRGRDAAGAE